MYTICFFISLCLPLFNKAFSQKTPKDRSFELSSGIQILKIRDFNFSPMMYYGSPYYVSVGLISETSRYLDITNINLQTGKIRYGDIGSVNNTRYINGTIDWIHVRRINALSNEKRSFFLGGTLNSSFTQYQRNYYKDNSFYLYQSSLGPAILIRNDVILGDKQITFENHLNFSLLAYSVYPSYSSPLTDKLIKKDMDKIQPVDFIFGGKVHFIDKFQRIGFASSLKYPLSKKISLKLHYNWEFLNIVRSNNLTKANHDIFLSLIIE